MTWSDQRARLWDTETGSLIALLDGHEKDVTSAAFSPLDDRIVTASSDKTARLWDAATGSETLVLSGHTSGLRDVVFSTDGTRIVTAGDKTARLWDVQTGDEIVVFKDPDWVQKASFSSDSKRVVTVSQNQSVRLWDVATATEIAVLTGYACVFGLGGRYIATKVDNTVHVWDAQRGTEVAILGTPKNSQNIALSPDGKRVVTLEEMHYAGRPRVMGLWDVPTGVEIARLEGHLGNLSFAAFSPDGKRIVTTGDTTARLWDAGTGAKMDVLKGHTDQVLSAKFSPNGKQIVTTSRDRTARLWDVARAGIIVDDRALALAAGLARGIGLRSESERQDLLMQDAPDDLFEAVLGFLGSRVDALNGVVAALKAPLSPNCYLSPSHTAAKLASVPSTQLSDLEGLKALAETLSAGEIDEKPIGLSESIEDTFGQDFDPQRLEALRAEIEALRAEAAPCGTADGQEISLFPREELARTSRSQNTRGRNRPARRRPRKRSSKKLNTT